MTKKSPFPPLQPYKDLGYAFWEKKTNFRSEIQVVIQLIFCYSITSGMSFPRKWDRARMF
jgi:hypothetical protein